MKKKKLIVSGCSFTFEKWNWPGPTSDILNMDLINVGMGSQGNGLISKKIIYTVDQELKNNTNNDDILVGIMWSGIDRHEIYIDRFEKVGDNKYIDPYEKFENSDGWIENPTKVIEGNYNWLILNHHWKTDKAKKWYEYFHTDIGATIYTIQNILLTQLYLEKKNVKYFMINFMDIFGLNYHCVNHPEVKYLYDMIDFDKFIPINGYYEWVKEYYPNELKSDHPTAKVSIDFAKEVIVPFLIEKSLVEKI